jgi:hypothetical protein
MSESWASANARRACLNCGESGASLYVMPNGVKTRVCHRCSPLWPVRLIPREPMYEETQYEAHKH